MNEAIKYRLSPIHGKHLQNTFSLEETKMGRSPALLGRFDLCFLAKLLTRASLVRLAAKLINLSTEFGIKASKDSHIEQESGNTRDLENSKIKIWNHLRSETRS